jgi:hypothetical protein
MLLPVLFSLPEQDKEVLLSQFALLDGGCNSLVEDRVPGRSGERDAVLMQ